MHAALLRERSNDGAEAGTTFGGYCKELLRLTNKDTCTPQTSADWWQHRFARLPCSVEQLLKQREQLLQQRRAACSAAVAALRATADPREAVLQSARAAVAAAVTAFASAAAAPSEDAQKEDSREFQRSAEVNRQQLFFNSLVGLRVCSPSLEWEGYLHGLRLVHWHCMFVFVAATLLYCLSVGAAVCFALQVEGEGALHGLESMTVTELLGQLLRVLVASLVEQCRLACACVLVGNGQESTCCIYAPGVAAARFGRSSSGCKGQWFPCHIPALQAAADDLQRHAIAHAAGASTAAAAAADDGLAWIPSLSLLAACMRCEFMFSAAVGLCRLVGTDPPSLAVVNRALQLLLLRLQQQEQAAAAEVAAAAATSSTGRGDKETHAVRRLPEAECDILVPILSCSEKRALQQMLNRCHDEAKNTSAAAAATAAPPWEAVLPWPPFAQEFVLLLQPHTADGKQQDAQRQWAFYCREQHADRAFAVTGGRYFH
ncbi:uncharacterized protein EMH_0014020 [Eimeria mitis]|uniref:Uncharacterized protein n=1 Tax=Eimeria mitis TaxID=44415 RepID=U6JTN5_9EIME|nr:uncharacterized protein EMH_0014020 [Eimeria mitis]CDJ28146.1 hypothetical protein EMH_0014020 [Eimeria mitis]